MLFFDRSGPTREVWYYEQPLPAGRQSYSKTAPMQFEELRGCLDWWGSRVENAHAWKVAAAELLANGCNLDLKNPHAKQDREHLPPEVLLDGIVAKERQIVALLEEVRMVLEAKP